MALRYPRVPGKVILSQVTEEPGDEGPVRHAVFQYAYSVACQPYTCERCRYGSQSNSPARVETLPVGTEVDVYYNPGNPADACVYRGVDGSDLCELMFLTPFNVIMVIGWYALIQDWRQRRQPGWIAAGVVETRSPWASVRPSLTPAASTLAPTIGPPVLTSFAQTSVFVSETAR